ncbi:MAG: GNAT family N-acetyltransferase [Anaerotignum sp.]|nr:GNAT family N-acetyltransferase [Anaerotignum sp.]
MIKMEKIPNGKQWAEEIAGYLSRGMKTNFYGSAEEFLPELDNISKMEFDGGCYLFHEKEKQTDLYFFLEKEAKLIQLPEMDKPLVLEQVAVAKNPPALEEWEAIGFENYLQRKRLFLSAKKTEGEQREISFAKVEEAEVILAMMQDAFEPYTSALPDLETLKKDLTENRVIAVREDENLLGFLRFGREKKVSVLWQIVVSPEGRGKGIGNSLVRDWISLEREDVAKFQLWVREDNPPALRMYEALGFLPDGRIAPVMLKK